MKEINKQRKEYLNWDQYFMGIAKLSAMRSKDPSTQVGACIVGDDNRILSIGYNGWSVDYVISSGILAVDIGIIVLMICNHRNWQSYIMWQLFMILCSAIPLVLYITGIEKLFIMAVLPAFVSIFLFLGTLLIGGRRAVVELKRRFHI